MTPAPVKPTISFDVFSQVDIRVGTVRQVEDVSDSTKLLKLTVDLGNEERTILAGLKTERADPSELEGQQALFVVNLEPRRMAGEMSHGMLFDVGYADGVTPCLAIPEAPVPNSTRLG